VKINLLFILLISNSLYAITLDEIISKSLRSNPSLKSINKRILANKENIKLSNQFDNPMLSISKNTIDTNQAMSKTTINFEQKIPYFNKRKSATKVTKREEDILKTKLIKAKVSLVEAIKEQAYTIWELKELYSILIKYETITKQNIDLHESYTSVQKNQYMGIVSAQLTLSNLKIQRSVLKSKIISAYARLSYLASFKIKHLDINLAIDSKPTKKMFEKALINNPDILLKEKQILKQDAKVEVAKLNYYPDFTLRASYSQRVNFDDYATIGFGVSLPIYGSEEYKEQKQRELVLSLNSLKEDTKISIESTLDVYLAQMNSDYEIYHIIKDEALPQVQHMFDITNSSVSTGADLFKYIDILIQKLKLEEKSIKAVTSYNITHAKIQKLAGKLK